MTFESMNDDELAAYCSELDAKIKELRAELRAASAAKAERDNKLALEKSELFRKLRSMTNEEYEMLKQMVEADSKVDESGVHNP